MATFKYIKYVGDNWSCIGKGFHEHKKTLYLYAVHRTFAVSLIWAIDPFDRICTSPFSGRMNNDWIRWRILFLQLYISQRLR